MKRRSVIKPVFRLLLWVGLAAVAAYWLRRLDPRFEIVFVGAVVVSIWLATALVGLLLGLLIEADE
ncbi:MAG: hypothetical protein KDI79_30530 [Anaerolineae bacterium]|nr:hypothetical protein [Anaerolineae bacterium]